MNRAVLPASIIGVLLSAVVGCGYQTAPSRYGVPFGPEEPIFQRQTSRTGAVEVLISSDGYQTQATAAEVKNIKLTVVPASAGPISKTVAKGQSAVIDNLAAGKVDVTIDALDEANNLLGTVSKSGIDVLAGQTTTLKLSLKLNPTIVSPSKGALGLDVTLVDGDVIVTPTPTPGPTATPTPPPSGNELVEGFESGFGKWIASFEKASYSSAGSASSNWSASTYSKTGAMAACAGNASGQVLEPGTYRMAQKDALNTSGMANPKLDFEFARFTAKYYFKSGAFAVEASSDNGTTWSKVWNASADQAAWSHASAALPKAALLKIRFAFTYDYYLGSDIFGAPVVDDVAIADAK